jgi:hypothetical protein
MTCILEVTLSIGNAGSGCGGFLFSAQVDNMLLCWPNEPSTDDDCDLPGRKLSASTLPPPIDIPDPSAIVALNPKEAPAVNSEFS